MDRGYEVLDAPSGDEALLRFRDYRPDLILVDLNMLGMGGFEVCHELRAASEVPIIVISVRDAEKDIVRALDEGADDYIVKPFRTEVLLVRMRAALRRGASLRNACPRILTLGAAEIDLEARPITTERGSTHLAPKEFDVLRMLLANANKVVSYRKLLQSVWGPDYGDEVDYLRVVVNQPRRKIKSNPAKPEYILTEPRVGYRLITPEHA